MFAQLRRKDAKSWFRLSLTAFYFIQGLVFASWASRIPDIKSALEMNEATLGFLLLFLPFGQLLTMTLAGWAVGRFGSRRMVLISASLYPLALILIGSAGSVPQLATFLFLFGIFANFANISVNTQAVGIERLYCGRSIMASFHGTWSLAGLCGGLLGMAMVAADVSPLSHFIIVYFIGMALLLSARKTMLPRDKRITAVNADTGKRPIRMLPDRYLLILGLIAFGAMTCEGTMFDWSSVYFTEVVQPHKSLTRLGYVASLFAMMSGRFVADRFITRFGVVPILQISGLIIAAGLFTVSFLPYVLPATLGFMLVGFGVSAVVPIAYSLSGRSQVMESGAAIAAVSTIGLLGFLLGPPVIGLIAHLSSLRYSMAMIALVGLFITLFAGIIKRNLDRGRS